MSVCPLADVESDEYDELRRRDEEEQLPEVVVSQLQHEEVNQYDDREDHRPDDVHIVFSAVPNGIQHEHHDQRRGQGGEEHGPMEASDHDPGDDKFQQAKRCDAGDAAQDDGQLAVFHLFGNVVAGLLPLVVIREEIVHGDFEDGGHLL